MAVVDAPIVLHPPPPTTPRPHSPTAFPNRVLFLVSAPLVARQDSLKVEGIPPLHIYEELDCVASAFRSAAPDLSVTFDVCVMRSPNIRFITALTARSLILHYVGHGRIDGAGFGLLTEDTYGVADIFPLHSFQQLLANIGSPPCKLAVLNVCYSAHLAACLIDAGVEHVVAIDGEHPVADIACRRFSSAFYPALLHGHTVTAAFELATSVIASDSDVALHSTALYPQGHRVPEHSKFKLLPTRVASTHNKPLQFESTFGEIRSPAWDKTNLPPYSTDPFVGRGVEIHEICQALVHPQSPPIVGIHGIGGMGKTALAEAVARWQHERSLWDGGSWFLPCRNMTDANDVLRTVAHVFLEGDNPDKINSRWASRPLMVLDDVDELIKRDPHGLCQSMDTILRQYGGRIITTSRSALPGSIRYLQYDAKRLPFDTSLAVFRRFLSSPPTTMQGPNIQNDISVLMEFLDGYPFVIRLAASYADRKRLTISELTARLFENPRSTLRYINQQEHRDSSLWATLDLSYDDLHPDAKIMFCYLAAFPSGLSSRMTSYVFRPDAVEWLETLMLYSMAEVGRTSGVRRFYLPEPARHYAHSKSTEDMWSAYGSKVLEFYDIEATRWSIELSDSRRLKAINEIDAEYLNIMRCVAWGLENEKGDHGRCRTGRIKAYLIDYTLAVIVDDKALGDAVTDMGRAINACVNIGDLLGEAITLEARARLCLRLRNYDDAVRGYRRAIEVSERAGDFDVASRCGAGKGIAHQFLGNVENAISSFMDAGRKALKSLTREARQVVECVNDVRREIDMYGELLVRQKTAVRTNIPDVESGNDIESKAVFVVAEAARMKKGVDDNIATARVSTKSMQIKIEWTTRMFELAGDQISSHELSKAGADIGEAAMWMSEAANILMNISTFDVKAVHEVEALDIWGGEINQVSEALLKHSQWLEERVQSMDLLCRA